MPLHERRFRSTRLAIVGKRLLLNAWCPDELTTASGQKRKSATMVLMSVKPPKAEVAIDGADVRFVPLAEVVESEDFSAEQASAITN